MAKKVFVEDLRVGMYIEQLDRPWVDSPFLFQGLLLKSMQDINAVNEVCHYVFVSDDSTREHGAVDAAVTAVAPVDPVREFDPEKPASFAKRLTQLKQVYDDTRALIDQIHEDVRTKKRLDTQRTMASVKEMVSGVAANPDALIWLSHLKHRDEYTAIHSINVCILSLVFGRHLKLEETALIELGLGGLLHDIGKLRIPLDILNKPDKLTMDEFEIMKKHPGYGVEFLRSAKELPAAVVNVVYSHHERFAGGGYPVGFPLNRASDVHTQIVSVVDIYDALTSDRVYRQGMPTLQAAKLMQKWSGSNFPPDLVGTFIESLGVMPTGTLVKLNTGEIGIVLPSYGRAHHEAIVLVVLDPQLKPYQPLRIVDLRLFKGRKTGYRIEQELPNDSHGVNIMDYAEDIASAQSVYPPS